MPAVGLSRNERTCCAAGVSGLSDLNTSPNHFNADNVVACRREPRIKKAMARFEIQNSVCLDCFEKGEKFMGRQIRLVRIRS